MSLEDKAKETPEQKELRIVTAVGCTAVKVFVERLREWTEQKDPISEMTYGNLFKSWELLDYADKLIEQMDKENE